MTKFSNVELTATPKAKIVLLYVGCKLLNLDENINSIINKVILAGISSKRITFSNLEVVYEAQEIIKFVSDYTYEEMHRVLLPEGYLNKKFMTECENPFCFNAVLSSVIKKVFCFKYFDEIDEEDILNAFVDTITLKTNQFVGEDYIPKNSEMYRHNILIEKAIKAYDAR